MTLLSALRATKVLGLAVVLVAGGMTAAADARDGWHRGHGHHTRFKRLQNIEEQDGNGWLGTTLRYSGRNRPIWREDGSFYSGAITAYRYRNDTYFYVNGDGAIEWNGQPKRHHRQRPKVITIKPGVTGCAWEAGVCVIRPGF